MAAVRSDGSVSTTSREHKTPSSKAELSAPHGEDTELYQIDQYSAGQPHSSTELQPRAEVDHKGMSAVSEVVEAAGLPSTKAPAVRLRFIAGGGFVALSAVAFLAVAAQPGEQPTHLILLISALVSSLVVLVEIFRLSALTALGSSPFTLLPFIGAAAVCGSAFWATLVGQEQVLITPLFSAAPALAVATLLVGNGLALRSLLVAREDSDFLFLRRLPQRIAQLGQAIECRAGDVIAVDGRIQSGCIALDERRLSPVPCFRIREEDEVVYAGSEVLAGSATVIALTTTSDASLSQLQSAIGPLIQSAKRSLELEDARASRWSALLILFLALSAGIFWHERTAQYAQALLAAGTVALFGSVCGVGVLLHGLRRGLVQTWMQRGYLLAAPDSVKQLAGVRNVECDASRCGEGSLLKAVSLDVLDDRLAPAALCDFICALVGRAENPVLVAVAEYCRRHGKTPSIERVVDLYEYAGRGVCGSVHGVELSIGTEDFLVERGIMIQPSDGVAPTLGEYLVMVAIDDDVVARAHVIDGQTSVVCADHASVWSGDVQVGVSPGVARSLGDDTLLIRGNESALVGQVATRDMTFFDPNEGSIQRSSVVAFTPEIAPLEDLLSDCRTDVQTVDRVRLIVGFGGLMVLVSVFVGAVTPLIPLLLVSFVGIVVQLSNYNLSTQHLPSKRI